MEFDREEMFANSEYDVEQDIKFVNDYLTKINNAKIEKEKYMKAKKEVQQSSPNKEYIFKNIASSSSHTLYKRSVNSDTNDADENIDEIFKRRNAEYKSNPTGNNEEKPKEVSTEDVLVKYNVNPFKIVDTDILAFVNKLVLPVLMVHLKINRRVQPTLNLRDVCFNKHIHEVLKKMSIKSPMLIQMVSWPIILRGHSLFMVNPPNSGKTVGYLPAVCRLVSDSSPIIGSTGPKAIIVCATAKSVENVERMAKRFLGLEDRVLAYYPGVDDFYNIPLLYSCDLLISTPYCIAKILYECDCDVVLSRLSIFVLDDCERLFKTYGGEIKLCQIMIKKMLKKRTPKELKVQYILASRVWCDNMVALARKAPDTVICIGAFEECVQYSKTDVSVSFIKSGKERYLFDFLQSIDKSEKTVIICRSDDEVEMLEKALKKQIVYATNKKMSVTDLYDLSVSWSECNVSLLGPILICSDDNLTHMNITDAHNLVHFSLPHHYSMFCKRFSVLNDNYPSIFKNNSDVVKIKIFVEASNGKQLPKIINFIKRFTDVPDLLDGVCKDILKEEDVIRAKNLVPLCDSFLMLRECPDFFNCNLRHTILKDYDMPLEWLPTEGFITFEVLHYNSATSYFGRLLFNISDGNVVRYLQMHCALSLIMGSYYSREVNRKLHGDPKVGDICAVSIKVNRYVRCQVVKILSKYESGNPNKLLIKIIDEERYEVVRDINLYHLPKELKTTDTCVVQIRLTNVTPAHNDIAFSDLSKNHIKKIIDSEKDYYLRGHITLIIGNCIFIDTLEVCQYLTPLNVVLIKDSIKHELLENHAILNEDLLPWLKKMCTESGLPVTENIEPNRNITEDNTYEETEMELILESLRRLINFKKKNIKRVEKIKKKILSEPDKNSNKEISQNISVTVNTKNLPEDKVAKEVLTSNSLERSPDFEEKSFKSSNNIKKHRIIKSDIKKINDNNWEPTKSVTQKSFAKVATNQPKGEWASFESDDYNCVSIASSKTPEQFFMRILDFESSMETLFDDIQKYVPNVNSNQVILLIGEIVLAKFSDDSTYDRARIEEINGDNVKCFFLDHGDWIDLPTNHLRPITEEFINRMPFQAIECKLLGVRAPDDKWIDSTNKWFYDYCFEDENGKLKELYAKYYTKERAEYTGGFKYGIILIDTSSGKDVLINQLMIDLDLAKENADEAQYFENEKQNATNEKMAN